MAAMHFDDTRRNGKAQAEAGLAVVAVEVTGLLVKTFENMRQFIGGYTVAGIRYRDLDLAVTRANLQAHMPAVGGVLEGIVNQVIQHPFDHADIGRDIRHLFFDDDLEDIAFGHLRLRIADGPARLRDRSGRQKLGDP